MKVKIERGEWKWYPLVWLPDDPERCYGVEIEMTEKEYDDFDKSIQEFERMQNVLSERAYLAYRR
jgi:hypothetical protein